MKIYPIVDLESNWGPKKIYDEFRRYADLSFVSDPESADVIWVMSYYADLGAITEPRRFRRLSRFFPFLKNNAPRRRKDLKDKLIICSAHHFVPGKEAVFLPYIKIMDEIGDIAHFFSKTNIETAGKYFHRPIFHLPYWIDLNLFKPLPEDQRLETRARLGVPGGRMVIGSFQRDTEGDLITPKLEKGPDIFCDIIERLDRNKIFILLTGPRRNYVEARLASAGVPYESLGHVDMARMPALYNCLDRYLVTSRVEGGPLAILECMATRTPIFSTPVGICEALSPAVVLSSVDEFAIALHYPYPDVLDIHQRHVRDSDAKAVVKAYERAFASLLDAYRRSPANLPALARDIQWFNAHPNRQY